MRIARRFNAGNIGIATSPEGTAECRPKRIRIEHAFECFHFVLTGNAVQKPESLTQSGVMTGRRSLVLKTVWKKSSRQTGQSFSRRFGS